MTAAVSAPPTRGPVLFARYAYPPNALGYCGPDDSRALLEYAAARVSDGGLVRLARGFEGAWPYLALIAAANRRPDPLDPDVVEAYWLGGPMLEQIPAALLAADLVDRFDRRIGRPHLDLGALAFHGGRAHHNFHVFAVYPWIGLLRAGRSVEALRVLDSCRIAWGTVESVRDGRAVVAVPPLVWRDGVLSLGPPGAREVTVAEDGYALAGPVRVGDAVTVHWGWLCDVVDARRVAVLRHYTLTQLALANSPCAGGRLGVG